MPKNNKLPLTQENSNEFFQKLKIKDESCYKEVIKVILQFKNEEISTEVLTNKMEEILNKYPELYEEALLFIDSKKINTLNYRKNNINKNSSNGSIQNNSNNAINQNNNDKNQNIQKKENQQQKQNLSPKSYDKYTSINHHHYRHDTNQLAPKIQSNPDYVFFSGLKELFTPEIYKILIKILYLYIEGIISQYEFTVLITPYFNQQHQQELLEFFKTLTNSKILNRRQHAIFDRPMCEIDFSKTRKISGYYELPKEYPILISSGRT